MAETVPVFGPTFLEEYAEYTEWKRAWLEQRALRGNRILDLGCAGGILDRARVSANEVHGVDIDPGSLEAAAAKGYRPHAFDLARGGCMPFSDGVFDIVLAFDILEHLPNPAGALTEIRRALRCGGLLVVSVPNSFNVINRLWALAGQSTDFTDRHHQLGLPFSDHLHRIALPTFGRVLAGAGFELRDTSLFVPHRLRQQRYRWLQPAWSCVRWLKLPAILPTWLAAAGLFACEKT